jgi:hypothetical protein
VWQQVADLTKAHRKHERPIGQAHRRGTFRPFDVGYGTIAQV